MAYSNRMSKLFIGIGAYPSAAKLNRNPTYGVKKLAVDRVGVDGSCAKLLTVESHTVVMML